jgi:hypothetical protein
MVPSGIRGADSRRSAFRASTVHILFLRIFPDLCLRKTKLLLGCAYDVGRAAIDAIHLKASRPRPRKRQGGKFSGLQSLENPLNRKIRDSGRPDDGVAADRHSDPQRARRSGRAGQGRGRLTPVRGSRRGRPRPGLCRPRGRDRPSTSARAPKGPRPWTGARPAPASARR